MCEKKTFFLRNFHLSNQFLSLSSVWLPRQKLHRLEDGLTVHSFCQHHSTIDTSASFPSWCDLVSRTGRAAPICWDKVPLGWSFNSDLVDMPRGKVNQPWALKREPQWLCWNPTSRLWGWEGRLPHELLLQRYLFSQKTSKINQNWLYSGWHMGIT